MRQKELQVLKQLRDDLQYYSKKCLKIVDKNTGQLVPFVFNRAQAYIHQRLEEQKRKIGKVRAVIVKGRQQGCSTYVAARYFHAATLQPGTTVFILAHMSDSTNHLFGMAKKYYENAPSPILPTIDKMNERRLEFKHINSSYGVGTAGSANIGRSFTLRRFHGSECAFWEHSGDIASGVLQAVPDAPDTEMIFESTANGPGDWFHAKAMAGLAEEGEFITIFVPWYWQPEYRKTPPKGFNFSEEESELMGLYGLEPDQVYWRRVKINDTFGGEPWRFKREYPMTVEEGFLATGARLIDIPLVIEARKSQAHDLVAPVVGGCDPARTRDRTVTVLRRGREIIRWKKYDTMDEMTCAGIIADEIERYGVLKYFVDVGCGYGTVDRLRELGYGCVVQGIHFGANAMEKEIFTNKGAEMADAVKRWFEEGGVNIPDNDDFQADLTVMPPLEKKGSRGRLGRVSKDDVKKDFGKSPDIFDALSLTFAFPVASRAVENRIKRAALDVRRPGSPLMTVRDFNRVPKQNKPCVHNSKFDIK